jgi:23S rRNA pseudouridine1911/1915/1917 synthase
MRRIMVREGPETNPMSSEENGGDYRDAVGDDPTDVAVETRTFEVDEALHGQRLDKAMVVRAPEFSRSHLQTLIERGLVQVDGVAASSASRKLRLGQRVAVELRPTEESRAFVPQPMAIAVVHEDEHLLVIDKPAGLVVHPAPGNWQGTLLNGLLARYPESTRLARAGIVHRLDKDTSGLMVVARTLEAMTALTRAIAAREVRREYFALVHGEVPVLPFEIDAPIGRDPVSRVRMAVVPGGRPSRTGVTRVGFDGVVSAVQCRLHTGRTHQIRVHLAWRGHPLVGDAVYGGRPALGVTRQALHAARLGFVHPASGLEVGFEAPMPADLIDAWGRVTR